MKLKDLMKKKNKIISMNVKELKMNKVKMYYYKNHNNYNSIKVNKYCQIPIN